MGAPFSGGPCLPNMQNMPKSTSGPQVILILYTTAYYTWDFMGNNHPVSRLVGKACIYALHVMWIIKVVYCSLFHVLCSCLSLQIHTAPVNIIYRNIIKLYVWAVCVLVTTVSPSKANQDAICGRFKIQIQNIPPVQSSIVFLHCMNSFFLVSPAPWTTNDDTH